MFFLSIISFFIFGNLTHSEKDLFAMQFYLFLSASLSCRLNNLYVKSFFHFRGAKVLLLF